MYRIHFDQVRDYQALDQIEQTSAEWAKLGHFLWDKAVQTTRTIFGRNEKAERGSATTRVLVGGAVLAVAIGLGNMLADGPAEIPPYEGNLAEYTVRSGDTLWDIASSITPEGEDVRVTINRLMATNGMEQSGIDIGQVIMIPVLDTQE